VSPGERKRSGNKRPGNQKRSGKRNPSAGERSGKQNPSGGERSGKRKRSGNQRSGNQKRSGNQNRSRPPAADRDRPFWGNAAAEEKVHGVIDLVRPAPDPSAVVRSLGTPPLGRFADHAPPFYAAVYETAQRLAVATATANGMLVVDDALEADDDVDGQAG
jgi:hypothetical protein